jgi:hypothetical protein
MQRRKRYEELAELLAEMVRCTLMPAHAAPADALQTAFHAFMQYLNRTTALVEEQFQQEVES